MKEGWKMVKLGEVFKLQSGENLPAKHMQKGKYPVYGGNGISGYHNTYNMIGDNIIIGRVGALCGNARYITEPFWLTDNGFRVILNTEYKIDYKYLTCYLNFANLRQYAKQTAQPVISNVALKEVDIILPPLEEQHRIVSILDESFEKIDALKKNAEKNLKNAKALFQQVLAQELKPKGGWVEKKLGEIGDIQTGTTPDTKDKTNFGNFIPFVKPADVNYDGLGGLNYNNEGLSESGVSQSRLIKRKSVLMVCIGATISKTGYNICDVTCNQQINTLTPYKDDYKYCYYAMIAPCFKYEILKEGNSHQTTLPIINKKKWSNLIISLPPLEEQHRIVRTLDTLSEKCRRLEQVAQQTIRECDALKQSILRQAFSGEL